MSIFLNYKSIARRRTQLLLCLSTILCAGFAAPVLAQNRAPAVFTDVDENGVDLVLGTFETAITPLSVGSGKGALTYGFTTAKGVWGSNTFTGGIEVVGAEVTVYIAGDMEKFTLSGSTYTSQQREGSMLTLSGNLYTYTRDDGTVMMFDRTKWPVAGTQNALPTSVRDPDGSAISIFYKTVGTTARIQSVTNNRGYQLKYNYPNATSAMISGITAINNAIDYCNPTADSCAAFTQAWPSVGVATTSSSTVGTNVYTITDAANRVSRYTINAATQVAGIKRPTAASDNVTIAYDGAGKVASVNANGVTHSYAYVVAGNVATLTRTNPFGQTMVATSALSIGRPTSIKDELNRTTSYAYDPQGRLITRTSPEGNSVAYIYDIRGNVTTTTVSGKPNSGVSPIATSAAYPASCTNPRSCNKPTNTTDALGRVTDYSYDITTGEVTSVTAPAAPNGVRPQQRVNYASLQAYYKNSSGAIVASGQPIALPSGQSSCQTTASCVGAADEVKVTIGYGAQSAGVANNLLAMSVSSGSGNGALTATSVYSYDAIGNATTVDGPLPGAADTVRIRYNAVRQAVGAVGPDPDGAGALKNRATRSTYNADGQITLSEVGIVNSQSDADWAGFTSLQQSSNSYDANARQIVTQVSAGATVYSVQQASYDALGRIDCQVQRMDPAQWLTQTVACTPQVNGALGPDRVSRVIYDAVGQVLKAQDGVGTALARDYVTYSYSSNGQTLSLTDAAGNRTGFTYDGHDRLSETHYPDKVTKGVSSALDYEGLLYDANGNITLRRLRDGLAFTYAYDNLGRLTSQSFPEGNNAAFSYDLLGRVTASTKAGQTLAISYDALGRPLTHSGPFGVNTYGYDLAGRRTSFSYPGGGLVITYDYLLTGETSVIRENGATALATYAYDNLGNRTSMTRGNGTVTSYAFDPLSRLSQTSHDLGGTAQDVTASFSYNPAGQIVSKTRSNDNYIWNGHVNVTRPYTTNGLNQYSAAGAVAFGYDGRGNLNTSGSTVYSYSSENLMISGAQGGLQYDPALRLYETSSAVYGMTRFGYDGVDLVGEYDAANILQRRYVHGPDSDEPIVWYEGAGLSDKRFLHADERGSIIAISDASGSVTNINSYDDYGIPASTNLGRFGYTGQTWLPNLGMYYYKARIYSPTLGRFMQSDPIGYGDGPNLYNYVGSDPVNSTDPSGLSDEIIVIASRIPLSPSSRGFGPGGGAFGGGGNDGGFGSYTNDRAEDFYNEQDNNQRFSCEAAGGTYSGGYPNSDCVVPQLQQAGFRRPGGLAGVAREGLRLLFRQALPKIKFPPNAAGLSQAEFGRVAGLPAANSGFRALSKTEINAAVQNLKNAGVTRAEVVGAQDFYSYNAFRDIGNETAAFRSYYLKQVVGGF